MKKKLQQKLDRYKKSITQQSLDLSSIKKMGLTSAAAMAAVVTVPVELNSQVVCGNQGTPTRTVGSCIGGAGNLGNYYSNYCAKFDFDGDGINELQVRYYNYFGLYPQGSAYVDPLQGTELWTVNFDTYFGYPLPANAVAYYGLYSSHFANKIYIVPLSAGTGYGFIAIDAGFYNFPDGNHTGSHPITGQPICCFAYGETILWGAHTGISPTDFTVISTDFTDCGNISTVLPVEFSSFETKVDDESIILHWTTETEVNNAGFAIERSIDGKTYEEIAFVDGVGESKQTEHYEYKDSEVKHGVIYYYRLRQIDYNGSYEFSDVKLAEIEKNSFDLSISPNPVNDYFQLEISGVINDDVSINMYSMNGEELTSVPFISISNTSRRINASSLEKGIYFLKVQTGSEVKYQKFVKQ